MFCKHETSIFEILRSESTSRFDGPLFENDWSHLVMKNTLKIRKVIKETSKAYCSVFVTYSDVGSGT